MSREKIFYFSGSTLGKLEFGFDIWQQKTVPARVSHLVSDLGSGPGMKRSIESVREDNITR